jgi:predicted Abi (CAAX) family protease
LPRPRDGLEALVMLALLGALALGLANWSEALSWDPSLPGLTQSLSSFLGLAVVAVLAPALSEELVFRGLLQPERLSGPLSYLGAGASLALFILWHPIQVWTGWFTGQAVFLDPAFLIVVAGLGLACTISVHRSGSLWPAAAMHWVVVVVWKAGN